MQEEKLSQATAFTRRPLPPAYFVTEPDSRATALTDAERIVPLYRFQPYVYPIEGQNLPFCPHTEGEWFLSRAEQTFLTNTKQNHDDLVRVSDCSARSNCHGWIFTGGEFVIQDADVPTILADNKYEATEDPRAGDIAVFHKGPLALHSGFVLPSSRTKQIRLESKWGPFGVFNHDVSGHPFGGHRVFYRSQRRGHLLVIRPHEN